MADKKKETPQKARGMKAILANRAVRTKVDAMFDDGTYTLRFILALCKESGVDISLSTLKKYRDRREEAISKGIDISEVIDKQQKSPNEKMEEKEVVSTPESPESEITKPRKKRGELVQFKTTKKYEEHKMKSYMEYLERCVEKSFKGVEAATVLSPEQGYKALDLITKLSSSSLKGLSLQGVEDMRARHESFRSAILEILPQFIPEENIEEAWEAIVQAELDFYENMDLTDSSDGYVNRVFKEEFENR